MVILSELTKNFHHINGNVRFQFYATLGAVDRLDFRNIEFYPGFYDTLSYSISHIIFLINRNFFINNLAEIMKERYTILF